MSEKRQARFFVVFGIVLLALTLGQLIAAVAAHPERTTFLWWVAVIAITGFALTIIYVLWEKAEW